MAADFGISIAEKLIETIGSAIIKEVCDMWGYKSELEDLKETVSTIQKVLLDAEAKQQLSHEEEEYIEKLKDAVYDADDLFDEFNTLAELKQLMKPQNKHGEIFAKVRRFFSPKDIQLGQAHRMSRDVKKIKKRLNEIANCRNKFGLSVDYKPISRRREETCSYVDAKDIIGRDKDKEAIIHLLLHHDVVDEESSCVTIVGVGGLGKTALAQLVYNDEEVRKVFPDLRSWVCVSDQEGVQFDVKTTLCKILEVVTNRNVDGSSTMELVTNQLHEQLKEKKYLIVLDDVWNEDRKKWLDLKKFLMVGRGGSRIIVTTRSEITGTIISENNNLYKLEGLSPENAWVLFELSAFNNGHRDECHDEFVAIGREIVEACCNIPLAIKVVGSLLYGQDISKWQSIKQAGLSKIGKGAEAILSILKLSYHNLEPSLKSCFSYCAMFPKDYVLNKEMLISLWMAQGYIMPLDGGQNVEDAAEEHFVILLRRCFFQDVRKDYFGYIESVKIHGLLHDVAQEVAKKEIQIVTSNTEKLGCNIRHMGYADRDCVGTLLPNAKIRSLLHLCGDWRHDKESVVFTEIYKLKFLRALEFRKLGVVKLPDSIGELIHLRYLDLSCNYDLEVLPRAITRLHNLETLLLYECGKLRELPKDFFKLNKLRHLDVQDCTKLREFPKEFCRLDKLRHLDLINCTELSCMPSGMEKLTSLKVLTRFVVGKEASREAQRDDELKPLKALTGISGEIMIEIGEYYRKVEGMDDMGGGYLKGMKHLALVAIIFNKNHPECEGVMGTLEPPSNVKALCIVDYSGMMIPKWGRALDDWAICFKQLTGVILMRCRNMQEMPVLSKLRFLKKLRLEGLDNLEYMETRSESQASDSEVEIFFPALEDLKIMELEKLKGWWKGVDDDHRLNTTPFMIFPCLSELEIRYCPELTSFPPCPPSLERLWLLRNNEALQIMVRAAGKEGENVVVTSNLRSLSTDNFSHLRSLPVDCLKNLFIYGKMGSEECVAEAEAFQRCASSVKRLGIMRVTNIRVCGLEHFTALKTLSLDSGRSIHQYDDNNSLFWKSIPQNLRNLEIWDLKEETSLPKGMQCLTFLQSLYLSRCKKLEEVPDWIDDLSSLQSLSIQSCPGIKSLPQSIQNLTSLQQLHIWDCPDLKERCKDPSGEDYPKIRHIPKRIMW